MRKVIVGLLFSVLLFAEDMSKCIVVEEATIVGRQIKVDKNNKNLYTVNSYFVKFRNKCNVKLSITNLLVKFHDYDEYTVGDAYLTFYDILPNERLKKSSTFTNLGDIKPLSVRVAQIDIMEKN